MADALLAGAIGWLAPLATYGLYALVHFCRPRRPIDPAPAFFIEAARSDQPGRT